MREHLDFYTVEELSEIVRRNAGKLRVPIEDQAATKIARRSRGTPRLANNRLRWVRDYAVSRADGRITVAVAADALVMLGVDPLGLDPQDRKYLLTIARAFGGGPVGVEAVAHTMNLSPDTLIDEVEPFLLRAELIVRSPRGRRLTGSGLDHLGIMPSGEKGGAGPGAALPISRSLPIAQSASASTTHCAASIASNAAFHIFGMRNGSVDRGFAAALPDKRTPGLSLTL